MNMGVHTPTIKKTTNPLLKGKLCDGHDTVIGVLGCQDVFSQNGLGIHYFLLENASVLTAERRSFFNRSCLNSTP